MSDTIIEIIGLSIQVRDRLLFSNASFKAEKGEAILISGANGIGKSTLLKSIMRLDTDEKKIIGSININGFGDVLSISRETLQKLRASVLYVSQRDDYCEMGNVQVRDIISESNESFCGRSLNYAEVNDLIDEWIPRRKDNSRIFDAKAKPARFSGGEQRLLSVFSAISTRSKTKLMMIDEPLNNLDYYNARNISNLINRAIQNNKEMCLLMVSHCRIFPFITRELVISENAINNSPRPFEYQCCFGVPDDNGYYR